MYVVAIQVKLLFTNQFLPIYEIFFVPHTIKHRVQSEAVSSESTPSTRQPLTTLRAAKETRTDFVQ